MLTKDQIIHKIEQHKGQIRHFGVTKLVLFGSYAKKEATAQSDIDFLVEFQEGRGLFDDYVQLLHYLEDLFGKKIDLGEPFLLREELKEFIAEGVLIEANI